MQPVFSRVFVFSISLLLGHSAFAADNEAMARAKFMLRQMTAEKEQLKSQNQSLLAENKQLEEKYAALEAKHKALVNKAEKRKDMMSGKIGELQERLAEALKQNRQTSGQLAEINNDKQKLHDIATEQTGVIDLCVSNNHRLYEINQELLGKYEDKGFWSVISQAEPFAGLKQVEIENLVDDYQYRLDDLRMVDPGVDKQTSL